MVGTSAVSVPVSIVTVNGNIGGVPTETGARPVTSVASNDTVPWTVPTPENCTFTPPPEGPRFMPWMVKFWAPVGVNVVGVIVCGWGEPLEPTYMKSPGTNLDPASTVKTSTLTTPGLPSGAGGVVTWIAVSVIVLRSMMPGWAPNVTLEMVSARKFVPWTVTRSPPLISMETFGTTAETVNVTAWGASSPLPQPATRKMHAAISTPNARCESNLNILSTPGGAGHATPLTLKSPLPRVRVRLKSGASPTECLSAFHETSCKTEQVPGRECR